MFLGDSQTQNLDLIHRHKIVDKEIHSTEFTNIMFIGDNRTQNVDLIH